MSGYTKLFSSILQSTIWLESSDVRVVWITLLAMADRDGRVESSIPGLAKTAGVERSACERALALFLSPDIDSRTKAGDGRRIEEIDGGWRLLNYEYYREKASADEIRARAAERQRRKRERDASRAPVTLRDASQESVTSRDMSQPSVTGVKVTLRNDKHKADAIDQDLGARAAPPLSSTSSTEVLVPVPSEVLPQGQDLSSDDPGSEVQAGGSKPLTPTRARFERWWTCYPKKTGKDAAGRVWERLKVSETMTDTLIAAVEQQKTWPAWVKNHGQYVPNPVTWLNQGRWQDEPPAGSTPKTTTHTDWTTECKTLHQGECGGDRYRHFLRKQTDEAKGKP